jgi:hypothetical protein
MKTKITWALAGALGLVCVYFSVNEIMSVLPKKTPVVGEKVVGQTPKETENPHLALNNRPVSILSPVEDLRARAEQGDAKAQFSLGGMYAKGEGVVKDSVEAVKWFRKAADQGSANAQLNLGNMYANGEGVAKDGAEAVRWYRKAADQGNANAQLRLGGMYMYPKGEGVTKDSVEAVKWFRMAADL